MGSKPAKSTSKPLSGAERADAFNWGMTSINSGMDRLDAPQYQAPAFNSPGAPQTLSGGDYDRLEENIVQSRWAPLQRFESLDRERVDQDLANRGIYSSGLAAEAQNDVTERLAPQYAAAGAEAATQRYGLQAGENQMVNQFNLDESGMKNNFDQNQALQMYQAQWAPLEYLLNLYNGTNGQVTTQTGAKKGWGGAIGTGLGAAGGFLLTGGNPAGAMAGGSLGGSIGGAF